MLYEKKSPFIFFVCKGSSNDDAGVARGTVFQGLRPGDGFKTGDFVKENLGGGYRRTARTLWNASNGVVVIVWSPVQGNFLQQDMLFHGSGGLKKKHLVSRIPLGREVFESHGSGRVGSG